MVDNAVCTTCKFLDLQQFRYYCESKYIDCVIEPKETIGRPRKCLYWELKEK